MSRLFIEFHLDEDVNPVVAAMLRAANVACRTSQDVGLLGETDAAQLSHAAAAGTALVTHNRDDFVALDEAYRTAGRSHAGIVIAFRRPPRDVADRLIALADDLTSDEMRDRIVFI